MRSVCRFIATRWINDAASVTHQLVNHHELSKEITFIIAIHYGDGNKKSERERGFMPVAAAELTCTETNWTF